MSRDIITYAEMCRREGMNLQRGMNYAEGDGASVILMSQRSNAPYEDAVTEEGLSLVYEGHDRHCAESCPNPKVADQPERLQNGRLTANGKFHAAAQEYKLGQRGPEEVHVYEKLQTGIWSFNGAFHLVDSWMEHDGIRFVFKFKLHAIDAPRKLPEYNRKRIIPSAVKVEVWRRDGGKCVKCGATDELHFDHVIPHSRGGTSLTADNVQLLCARHNLQKHNHIE